MSNRLGANLDTVSFNQSHSSDSNRDIIRLDSKRNEFVENKSDLESQVDLALGLCVKYIVRACLDKNWKFRFEMAALFPQLLGLFEEEVFDRLVEYFSNILLLDKESEVKVQAIGSLLHILDQGIPEFIIKGRIIPSLIRLDSETNNRFKSSSK